MSGTHHLYTRSGRPMPPPPSKTPRRSSSICRTPTRRFNPVERKLSADSAEIHRRGARDRQLVVLRNERGISPDSSFPNRSRLLIEDSSQLQNRQVSQNNRSSESRYVALSVNNRSEKQNSTVAITHNRPEAMRVSAMTGDAESYNNTRWEYHHHAAASQSPRAARSISLHESEAQEPQSIALRLRRSLSRGFSPQRGRPNQAVMGTELMAPMPQLQGTHRTSKNRDRTTIERFIESQPPSSQEEIRVMLEEYKGRESELCGALTDAYGDSWEMAVKGNTSSSYPYGSTSVDNVMNNKHHQESVSGPGTNTTVNGGRYFDPTLLISNNEELNNEQPWQRTPKSTFSVQSTPSRPKGNPNHAGKSIEKERYDDDDVSPQPRQASRGGASPRVGAILDFRDNSPRSGGMLTPPIPQDLIQR